MSIILLIKEIVKDSNSIVFAFQANIYCIIICKIFRIRVIVRSNSAPAGWSKNYLKRNIFSYFLHKAEKVIANSYDFVKSLKKEFNVNAVCIYNPLNLGEIKKKSKEKIKNLYSKNTLKILNIGRYTDQKDQITLLKALKLLGPNFDYEAIIVGKGILKKKLEKFIRENKLEKKVKLLNFFDNPYPIIKQCDLFILTSKYEGLPNVLLESIALKKFVISTNCPTGPREILLDGKGGILFDVMDYKQLCEKIIFFSKNRKKCKLILNNAIKNLSRFNLKKNLVKYYKLVKKI